MNNSPSKILISLVAFLLRLNSLPSNVLKDIMGRDCYFYLIDESQSHDRSRICLNWEHQPGDKGQRDLYTAMGFNDDAAFGDKFEETYEKFRDKLCQKCHWFFCRFEPNSYIKQELNIHHCYSNRILFSKFYVENLVIGSDNGKYDDSDGPVREITLNDVCKAQTDLKQYHVFLETKGREAQEESLRVLDTLKSWFLTAADNQIAKPLVIYQGEF